MTTEIIIALIVNFVGAVGLSISLLVYDKAVKEEDLYPRIKGWRPKEKALYINIKGWSPVVVAVIGSYFAPGNLATLGIVASAPFILSILFIKNATDQDCLILFGSGLLSAVIMLSMPPKFDLIFIIYWLLIILIGLTALFARPPHKT